MKEFNMMNNKKDPHFEEFGIGDGRLYREVINLRVALTTGADVHKLNPSSKILRTPRIASISPMMVSTSF